MLQKIAGTLFPLLLMIACKVYPDIQLMPYLELAGNIQSNYTHSRVPESANLYTIDAGVLWNIFLSENNIFQINYIYSTENSINSTQNIEHLHIASMGYSQKISNDLNLGFNCTYQSFLDIDYATAPITVLGFTPSTTYDISSILTAKLYGGWNWIDYTNTITAENLKALLGLRINIHSDTYADLDIGYSGYELSEASNNHSDLIVKLNWNSLIWNNLYFSFNWNIVHSDYYNVLNQIDTQHSLYLKLTQSFTDTFSIKYQINHSKRNSTQENRGYENTGFQIAVVYEPLFTLSDSFSIFDPGPSELQLENMFEEAYSYHKKKEYKKAIPILEKIIQYEPDYVEAYYLLSFELIETQNYAYAINVLNVLYSINKNIKIKKILEELNKEVSQNPVPEN